MAGQLMGIALPPRRFGPPPPRHSPIAWNLTIPRGRVEEDQYQQDWARALPRMRELCELVVLRTSFRRNDAGGSFMENLQKQERDRARIRGVLDSFRGAPIDMIVLGLEWAAQAPRDPYHPRVGPWDGQTASVGDICHELHNLEEYNLRY